MTRLGVEADVDLVIEKTFFSDPAYHGVIVDVGAATPDFLSISAHFRSRGWTVIPVEPNPRFCTMYRDRGWDVVEAACADRDADDVPFTLVHAGWAWSGGTVTNESWSSLGIRGKFAQSIQGQPVTTEQISVKVRRLDTILSEKLQESQEIDILSLDVEGWELEVLGGLSIQKYRPKVVIMENSDG